MASTPDGSTPSRKAPDPLEHAAIDHDTALAIGEQMLRSGEPPRTTQTREREPLVILPPPPRGAL